VRSVPPESLVNLVAEPSRLQRAWRVVHESVDGVPDPPAEIVELEARLEQNLLAISAALLAETWRPRPTRVVKLTKSDGSPRYLNIPPPADRIVERSLADVLGKRLDPDFHPSSYGYRPGCAVFDAVAHLESLRDEGLGHALRIDINDCFDRIEHERVLRLLDERFGDPSLRQLVAHLLVRPNRAGRILEPNTIGIAQGSPLSPLLSNAVLNQLDDGFSRSGLRFVRFADDMTIATESENAANDALIIARSEAAKLGLDLNVDKSKVVGFDEGFAFLGEDIGPKTDIDRMRALAKHDVNLLRALYVTIQGSALILRQGQIVVVHKDRELLEVPAAMVDPIILVGAVGLSAGLRANLLDRNVTVSFLSRRGRWTGRLDSGVGPRSTTRRRQYRMSDDDAQRVTVAKHFVDGKISNMRALLLRYHQRDGLPVLIGAANELREARRRLEQVQSVGELLGVEGAATAAYFGAFGSLFPTGVLFDGRSRRPPKDAVNAALSYGYSILLSEVISAIQQHGLDPTCGFMHVDDENRPSLALDLMEEFRPLIVDSVVVELFRRGQLSSEQSRTPYSGAVWLSAEGARRLIEGIEERLVTDFAHIPSKQRTTYRRAIGLQVRQLTNIINERTTQYEPVRWRQ
jgi:CRISP-associated protein Cas1